MGTKTDRDDTRLGVIAFLFLLAIVFFSFAVASLCRADSPFGETLKLSAISLVLCILAAVILKIHKNKAG